jgi:hypothetical protein
MATPQKFNNWRRRLGVFNFWYYNTRISHCFCRKLTDSIMKKPMNRIVQAYHTLGLRAGQDANQVKQAYRALARALHPDHNPETQTLMARINDAYNTLNEYYKTQKKTKGWFTPLASLRRGVALHLSSWLGTDGERNMPAAAMEMPAAMSEDESWILLRIEHDGEKLVYAVEIKGNPVALALPLRRRRPCPFCQGTGKIWDQGISGNCDRCEGKGVIVKSSSLAVALPANWQSGQRLPVDSKYLSVPLEVELHRPAAENKTSEFDATV